MNAAQVAMYALGAMGILLIAWVLYNAQHDRNNKIDLNYLLVDSAVGNVTLGKFGGLISLVASTWIIVYLAVTNKFDGVAYAAYLAAWAAVKIAGDITGKPVAATTRTTTIEQHEEVAPAGAPMAEDIEVPAPKTRKSPR